MELTHLEYLEEILNSKDACDHLTGYQKMVIDALTELLSYCPYERLCELAQADREGISPCTFCRFNPPSSGDGKPCCMCPAEAALRREQDG